MPRLISLCFSLLLLVMPATSIQAGTFYKWVDEQGRTHYTHTPPPNMATTKVKTYNDKSGTVTQAPATPPSSSETKKKQQEKPVVAKKDKSLCKKAKNNIQVLSSQPMVMREGKIMTIPEKNKEISKARKVVKVHC